MTTADYRDLFNLLVEGAVARSDRGGVDVRERPPQLIVGLLGVLPPADSAALNQALRDVGDEMSEQVRAWAAQA